MNTRILTETEQLVNQFLRPAAEAIASMFTIVAVVSLLLWVEPIIALVALSVISGIYGLIYWVSRRALKGLGRARVEANSARFRITSEALSGIKDIKLLGRESSYVARYETPSRSMAAALSTIEILITHEPQPISAGGRASAGFGRWPRSGGGSMAARS